MENDWYPNNNWVSSKSVSKLPKKNKNEAVWSKKKVAFSQNDEVRVFERSPDILRYDDKAFNQAACQVLLMIENEIKRNEIQKKNKASWMPSFFQSEIDVPITSNLEEYNLDKFKDAFEFRLKKLPEMKAGKVCRADSAVRELANIIQRTGWANLNTTDRGEDTLTTLGMNGGVQRKTSIVGDLYHTEINNKRNAVDMLSEEVRTRVSNHCSVETLMLEIKNLFKLANSTKDEEIKEYCLKEIKTMEYILEDMGFTRGINYSN